MSRRTIRVLCLSTLILAERGVAIANPVVDMASSQLVQAERGLERSNAWKSAIDELAARGHASPLEVDDAKVFSETAKARHSAAMGWASVIQSNPTSPSLNGTARVVVGPTGIVLPVSNGALEIPADYQEALRRLESDHRIDASEDLIEEASRQFADPMWAWKHSALLQSVRGVLLAELEQAIAKAADEIAVSRHERLLAVPEHARHQHELELSAARLEATRSDYGRLGAEALLRAKQLQFTVDLKPTDADLDWTQLAETQEVSASFGQPLWNRPLAEPLPEGGIVIARGRRTAPVEPIKPSGSPAATSARFKSWSSVEEEPPYRRPSQFGTIFRGRTYSSGYAFGEIRRDLPASERYPRADGFASPWYLPGSPANELRFRRRLMNDGR